MDRGVGLRIYESRPRRAAASRRVAARGQHFGERFLDLIGIQAGVGETRLARGLGAIRTLVDAVAHHRGVETPARGDRSDQFVARGQNPKGQPIVLVIGNPTGAPGRL